MSDAFDAVTLVTALGCAVAGGSLFPFSTFAMAGLTRLDLRSGIAAMQSINITAVTPPLMIAMFGTAAACLGVSVWAAVAGDGQLGWVLAGSALYLVGTIAVTVVKNVPLNNELARLALDDPASAEVWTRYVRQWRAWNHVRVLAALVAAGLLIIALAES